MVDLKCKYISLEDHFSVIVVVFYSDHFIVGNTSRAARNNNKNNILWWNVIKQKNIFVDIVHNADAAAV